MNKRENYKLTKKKSNVARKINNITNTVMLMPPQKFY